ncbi:MAG: hypothetical protein ACKO85_06085 [Isosphaeraceae bacterium]
MAKTSSAPPLNRRSEDARPASAQGTLLSRRKFGPRMAAGLATGVIAASSSVHGFSALKAWVTRQQDFSISPHRIRLSPEPPPWILQGRETIIGLITELSDPTTQPTTLNFDVADYGRRLSLAMPWIEKINSIAMKPHGWLEINLDFRRPLMALTLPDSPQILMDHYGTVLKATDVRKDMLENMIEFNYAARMVQQVIQRGGKSPGTLSPGEVWEDTRVLDSLKLADFITAKSTSPQRLKSIVRLIDCTSVRDTLLLRTTDRLWIVWGQPPGHEKPGEPDAETKWRFLANWLTEHSGKYNFDLERSMINFEKDRAVLITVHGPG